MLKMLTKRERVLNVSFSREFTDCKGDGYSFPCKENGEIFEDLNECAKANYQDCLNGKFPQFKDRGAVRRESWYTQPATGVCPHCGATVECVNEYNGAFQCGCGQWYNMFGQELLPPQEWQENEDY